MFFISILAGILTTILTILGIGRINSVLETTTVQGFSVLLVMPIGAIFVGGLAASGIYIVRRIMKAEFKVSYVFAAMILGLVSLAGITFMDYKSTIGEVVDSYVQEYGKLPTNEEIAELEKEYTFGDYFETIYKKTTITISSRRRSNSATISNEVISMISFWLTVAGVIGGGYFMHRLAVGNRVRRGGTYMDVKYHNLVDESKFEELQKFLSKGEFGDKFIEICERGTIGKRVDNRIVVDVMKSRSSGEGFICCALWARKGKADKKVSELSQSLTAEQTEVAMKAILAVHPKERF